MGKPNDMVSVSLFFISFISHEIRSKQMVCNNMLWIVAYELSNFEIKYPYLYCFGSSCNKSIYSFVKGVFNDRY